MALKGELLAFPREAGSAAEPIQPSVIRFQFNPETIAHTLATDAGASVETFGFTLFLDANEAPGETDDGFVPRQLAALEALIVGPGPLPAALFVWGPRRVVPVRLTTLDITERAFDAQLNPTRAEARIVLTVLTPEEIAALDCDYSKFLREQST